MINRFYIDRLRHRKYRPTGGVLPFMFRDTGPAVQSAIIDYWGVPKRSYAAMQLAFRPQYVFTLLNKDEYPVGAAIDLPVYVVNDAQREVPVQVVAQLVDPTGRLQGQVRRELTLPADCMAMEVERLRLTPPTPGTYRLALALQDAQGAMEQTYEIVVSSIQSAQ
jgi:beta-mannosidase